MTNAYPPAILERNGARRCTPGTAAHPFSSKPDKL